MTAIDPEKERQRLVETFSRQRDGELEEVAAHAYQLTEIARAALRAELTRRGLSPPIAEYPAGDEAEMWPMITIRQFRDLPEALFAKGSLESAGVDCALVDDNMVRLDWFISNLLGGVKLQVRPEVAAVAEEILQQPIPENFDVTGVGEYEQPRCPSCGSLDVNFQEVAPAAYVSAAVLSLPIPFHRRAWRCHACYVEWVDDAVPGTAESSS